MKSSKIIAFFLCLIILMAVPVTAGAKYSSDNTFELKSSVTYIMENANGNKVPDEKESASTYCHVKTIALTMYNNPVFKMVNINGVNYSNTVKMKNPGSGEAVAENNTGWKGGTFYAAVRASAVQTGKDSVRLCFSAD